MHCVAEIDADLHEAAADVVEYGEVLSAAEGRVWKFTITDRRPSQRGGAASPTFVGRRADCRFERVASEKRTLVT
jgi:hypothetical protein